VSRRLSRTAARREEGWRGVVVVFHVLADVIVAELNIAVFVGGVQPGQLLKVRQDLGFPGRVEAAGRRNKLAIIDIAISVADLKINAVAAVGR